MQNKLTIIKKSLPVFILLLFSCTNERNNDAVLITKEPAYKAFAVEKDDAESEWGYVIEHNHRLIIKQFYIPALAGKQPFKTKEQAESVGNLVADKLNQSKGPTISRSELDSLGITQLQHAIQTK